MITHTGDSAGFARQLWNSVTKFNTVVELEVDCWTYHEYCTLIIAWASQITQLTVFPVDSEIEADAVWVATFATENDKVSDVPSKTRDIVVGGMGHELSWCGIVIQFKGWLQLWIRARSLCRGEDIRELESTAGKYGGKYGNHSVCTADCMAVQTWQVGLWYIQNPING